MFIGSLEDEDVQKSEEIKQLIKKNRNCQK